MSDIPDIQRSFIANPSKTSGKKGRKKGTNERMKEREKKEKEHTLICSRNLVLV